jgi:hypothetical protein
MDKPLQKLLEEVEPEPFSCNLTMLEVVISKWHMYNHGCLKHGVLPIWTPIPPGMLSTSGLPNENDHKVFIL